MLGHRHRGPGTATTHKGRPVRRRRHDHRARHALGPQNMPYKVTQFAPPLTDQSDHDNIGLHVAGKMPQQHGLTDARAGKQPDALPPDDRQERVEHCLIPWFDGAILSQEWKEALWAKFVTGAPRPRTLSEQRYSDRKLRSQR